MSAAPGEDLVRYVRTRVQFPPPPPLKAPPRKGRGLLACPPGFHAGRFPQLVATNRHESATISSAGGTLGARLGHGGTRRRPTRGRRFVVACQTWGVNFSSSPHAGELLVSSEAAGGGFFDQAVIFLLDNDENGAIGVALNKPSTTPVAEVLPAWAGELNPPSVLFAGGPVAPTVRSAWPR